MSSQLLLNGAIAGVLATVVMDISSLIGMALGLAGRGIRRTGFHLIGRWFLYLFRGKFSHHPIAESPPIRSELPVGIFVHYAIGAILGVTYFRLAQAFGSGPDPWTAVGFGVGTTLLPWLYLYPVWGYGWLGVNASGFPLTYFSVFNHTFFGLGLALALSLGFPS